MKTVEIVQNLLFFLEISKLSWPNGLCPECVSYVDGYGHKENCKLAETKKAAEDYLKIMKVPERKQNV